MQTKRNKASREVNWHTPAARHWLIPPPQAQIGLQTVTIVPNLKTALLAVAVTTVCVIAAVVTAVEATGAVIDAVDMIDMGCSKPFHCAIQYV